jgi:hypothetical protein
MKFPKVSPAVVIACVALFFALTGAAVAGSSALVSRTSAPTFTTVYGPSTNLCPKNNACAIKVSSAACPPGMLPVGGGWVFPRGHPGLPANGVVSYDGPSISFNHSHWDVEMVNNASVPGGFRSVAICSR